jgi:hypothetical protein
MMQCSSPSSAPLCKPLSTQFKTISTEDSLSTFPSLSLSKASHDKHMIDPEIFHSLVVQLNFPQSNFVFLINNHNYALFTPSFDYNF